MEKNTKLIIGVLGLSGLGYYLYKKGYFSKNSATIADTPVASTKTTTPTYPSGYAENDYVRNPSGDGTVYMLKRGQKLPITYAWWMANEKLNWDSVKEMSAPLLMDIPTGTVLDA